LNLEVFCYLGLLRFREQLAPSLSLLPDDQKKEALGLLDTLKDLPKAEILQRWSRLREDEYVSMRKGVQERIGIPLDELPPSLRLWCASWWVERHG
jgi:hypothetical protein